MITRATRTRRRAALTVAVFVLSAVAATLILVSAPFTVASQPQTRHRVPMVRSSPVASGVPQPLPIQGRLVITANAPMRAIPPSFLGISTEYWALPLWARHLSLLDRVLALVRGPGPLVLRIGGDSADRTFWSPVRELLH